MIENNNENSFIELTQYSKQNPESILFHLKHLLDVSRQSIDKGRVQGFFSGKQYISKHTLAMFLEQMPPAVAAAKKTLSILLPKDLLEEYQVDLIEVELNHKREANNRDYLKKTIQSLSRTGSSVFAREQFNGLTKDQQKAVISDEDCTLVVSSAGSGKTRTLVDKYLYLTEVLKVPKSRVKILSYDTSTTKEINSRIDRILSRGLEPARVDVDKSQRPAATFHSFATNLIKKTTGRKLNIIESKRNDNNSNDVDSSPRAAMVYHLLSQSSIWDDSFFGVFAEFCMRFPQYNPKANKYLSFFTDRNNNIGALKSAQEAVIFNYLASHGIDFSYESLSHDEKAKPDFTIYSGDLVYYYEHFALDETLEKSHLGWKYVETARKKREDWGDITAVLSHCSKDDDIKELIKDKRLFYTLGYRKSNSDIIASLESQLILLDIPIHEPNERDVVDALKKKENYQKYFENCIDKCLELYDDIRETNVSLDDVVNKFKNEGGFYSVFVNKLFVPIIEVYCDILNSDKYDFTKTIQKAMSICNDGDLSELPYSYILIDEYQDISPLRFLFLKSMKNLNPDLKLFAVGDDWQSIYGFANSDLDRFREFESDWDYADIQFLKETFRFNEPLLSISETFLKRGQDPRLFDKTITSHARPPKKTKIELIAKQSIEYQYSFIINVILRRSLKPEQCLILGRKNADCTGIIDYIIDYMSKKPFDDKWEEMIKDKKKRNECFKTFHASKGLGSEYVFLLNCSFGSIPSLVMDNELQQILRNTPQKDKLLEERRLFYVALTRSEKKTFVLYLDNNPSDFVKEIQQIQEG